MKWRSFIRNFLGLQGEERPSLAPRETRAGAHTPRVLLIVHNPLLPGRGGRRLQQVLGWNDPHRLITGYVEDLQQASHGFVRYEIVERIESPSFPPKEDGFVYSGEEYLRCWQRGSGFHQPDALDYHRLLQEHKVVEKVNQNEVDEVWLFGFPYAGYYESLMVGPRSFWCNAPPLEERQCRRRFVVMGFNYERGVGEMLESFGHRVESIMSQVYGARRGEANLWQRFTRHEKSHPGAAECGTVHYAPNSERDYDWGNPRYVSSGCDDWWSFPHLQSERRMVNCREWGNGDTRAHHLWWLSHLPHAPGSRDQILNNWWTYVLDPNEVAV